MQKNKPKKHDSEYQSSTESDFLPSDKAKAECSKKGCMNNEQHSTCFIQCIHQQLKTVPGINSDAKKQAKKT